MQMIRIWKCPECGHAEEISYDWLAEHGGPICEQCDGDMTLQLETALDEMHTTLVERLVAKADGAGLEPEDIDDIVHELAASVAADVNNGGLEDQIKYLVDGLGAQNAEKQLDELIQAQPHEEQ